MGGGGSEFGEKRKTLILYIYMVSVTAFVAIASRELLHLYLHLGVLFSLAA